MPILTKRTKMEIQVFKNNDFGEVRTLVDERGEPWFVATDICKILNIKNSRRAVKEMVDEDDVRKTYTIDKLGRRQETTVVNESGLYSLILRSNKPEAKKFKKWVTAEVLPAIRKHGGYLTKEKVEEALLNPDVIIKLATDLKKEREAKNKALEKVEELKPKAFFAEVVNNSESLMLVRDFAKLISKGDFVIGERKLFRWLREHGYLMKNNEPYQKYVDMGLFKMTESSKADGKNIMLFKTTRITGKGQVYLQKRIYKSFGVQED